MRIHTDTITHLDIYDAARAAGSAVDFTAEEHASRTHARAYEVKLTGSSPRRPNTGRRGADWGTDEHAATWDEWGLFLAHLYDVDPDARAGGAKIPVYRNASDFYVKTGDRFDPENPDRVTPATQHRTGHRWTYDGGRLTCPCGATFER